MRDANVHRYMLPVFIGFFHQDFPILFYLLVILTKKKKKKGEGGGGGRGGGKNCVHL